MLWLVAPFVRAGFLIGHDGGAHQTYAALFDRAFRQSQWPVRWVEGLGHGLGQPLFNHYQVGFYYLVSLLHLVVPGLDVAFKLAIAVSWSLGALLTWAWLRPFGSCPAALGALVFASTPYVLVDAYVRTAYPELLALSLIPGVLWSIDRVAADRSSPSSRVVLSLMTAALLVTHLPVSVIAAPLCMTYAVVACGRGAHPRRALLAVGAAGLTGLAMAAFYVMPAVLEMSATQMQRMRRDYFDFHRHFTPASAWWDWSWRPDGAADAGDPLSRQVGVLQWAIFAGAAWLGLLAIVRGSSPGRRLRGMDVQGRDARARRAEGWTMLAWLGLVAGALFMTTALARPVWEALPPLAFVQFPWRFLLLPAVAGAALSARLLAMVRAPFLQVVILAAVAVVQGILIAPFRAEASARPRADIQIQSPDWPLGRNAARWGFREDAYNAASMTITPPPAPERWTLAAGLASVQVVEAADARLQLQVSASEPSQLLIRTPWYPGWSVRIDGRPAGTAIEPGTGYQAIDIPPGPHAIDARFAPTPVRRLANGLSVAGVVGSAIWCFSARRRRRSASSSSRPDADA